MIKMNDIILELRREFLNEQIDPYRDFTAWISPEYKIIKVADHLSFISDEVGCNTESDFDMEDEDEITAYENMRVDCYEKAFKMGWVRMIYEFHPDRRKNEIMLEGQNQGVMIRVIKIALKHLIFENSSIYIDLLDRSQYITFDLGDDKNDRRYREFMSGKIF